MILTRLSDAEVLELAAGAIPKGACAWLLVDSPEFVGLGAAGSGRLLLPKAFRAEFWPIVDDLRVFSDLGEWHAWRIGTRTWGARFRGASDGAGVREEHWMWGTNVSEGRGAACEIEESGRGIRFYAHPLVRVAGQATVRALSDADLPMRLVVHEIIDPLAPRGKDPGLARVVDARLESILTSAGVKLEPAVAEVS